MVTNAKETATFLIERTKQRNTIPALKIIMAREWQDQKIIADRAAYLKSRIEALLQELYRNKHESLLPKFDASKFPTLASDESTAENVGYDEAKPSGEEQTEIFSAMHKFSGAAKNDRDLIIKCVKSWVHSGVNDRTIALRAKFMRDYMERVKKNSLNYKSSMPNLPSEAEMEIIRADACLS